MNLCLPIKFFIYSQNSYVEFLVAIYCSLYTVLIMIVSPFRVKNIQVFTQQHSIVNLKVIVTECFHKHSVIKTRLKLLLYRLPLTFVSRASLPKWSRPAKILIHMLLLEQIMNVFQFRIRRSKIVYMYFFLLVYFIKLSEKRGGVEIKISYKLHVVCIAVYLLFQQLWRLSKSENEILFNYM